MIGGIALQAEGIAGELRQRLPAQRKTQRGKLALLVPTMLHARTANLMALAASLPLSTERADMRYQWIARFVDNERVVCDLVMEPFGREVLAKAAQAGRVTLIMDQTKASDRHQILMCRCVSVNAPCRLPGGSRQPMARSVSAARRRCSLPSRPGSHRRRKSA